MASDLPNVLLILSDDQAWNGLSIPMDPNNPESGSDFYQTPTLEALASAGMRFSNAYSAASICSPTRAALQTGKSPGQLSFNDIARPTGVRTFDGLPLKPPQWRAIADEEETLAERVKAADSRYVTGHIGKWHIEPEPEDLGFDIASNPVRASGIGAEDPGSIFAKTDAALDFLSDRASQGDPFFLQVSHFAVHNPIEGQAALINKYQNLPPGEIHNNPVYAAFTEALDTGVGMLLNRLQQLGLDDNTYVIYASDNGARDNDTSNFPLSGDKAKLLEGGIRTPLIIKGPGIQANSVSHVPVTTVDLFSTVSDLVGNTTPFAEGVEGASLRPLLENGGELPPGVEFLERQYSDGGAIFFTQPLNLSLSPNYRVRPMSAVRKDNFKLLRIHGENGAEDQDLLFDFSATLEESEEGGDLDVSSQHPQVVRELGQLLDNWIQGADISLAYDVAKPVNMLWRADQPGVHPDRWRSVTDVDQRWRETWEVRSEAERPAAVAASTHLRIPGQAYEFDGNDRLARRFFDVSDKAGRTSFSNNRFPTGDPDNDRSVAFEFVLRLDDLSSEQILFESGSTAHGVSLTLGDADGDGVHDEARFRILGDDGKHLTVTADIDAFAAPTRDFVNLTAVFSDDPTNRFAELFVNGASIGRADGAAGVENSLRWDLFLPFFNQASLGGVLGTQLGGGSGDGPQPFAGGSLRGQIASFRFINHAIDSQQAQNNYANLLASPTAGIVSTTGDAATIDARPVSVAKDQFELNGRLRVIHERIDQLDQSLSLDIEASPGLVVNLGSPAPLPGGALAAGTAFTSFLLHFDAEQSGGGNERLIGSVTFAAPILGLLIDEASLDASDLLLGVAGEFDLGDRALGDLGGVGVSADLLTLNFDLTVAQAALTQFRVLTEPVLSLSVIAGDYNGDGTVNAADHAVWLSAYGATGASPADGNFDGVVDAIDYAIWRENRGQSHPAGSTTTPEPTALALLAMLLPVSLVRRRGLVISLNR